VSKADWPKSGQDEKADDISNWVNETDYKSESSGDECDDIPKDEERQLQYLVLN